MSAGDVNYTGHQTLVQFEIYSPEMILKDKHFLVVKISFRRMFLYHLVSTFLPTICLLIVAEITMFIDESHFEATIMVSLTSMLVMYTLFQSHTDSLPQTAYIKLIDIWFLHGLVVPFFVFVLEVTTEMTTTKERIVRRKKCATTSFTQKKAEHTNCLNREDAFIEDDIPNQEIKNDGNQTIACPIDFSKLGLIEDECLQNEPKIKRRTNRRIWINLGKVMIPVFTVVFVLIYGVLAVSYYSR